MATLLPLNPKILASKPSEIYDFVVVGAGIFGSAFATTLAKDGHQVLLVERDFAEPDRIVGELLQPGGCQALKTLGLESCLEDIDGIRVDGYAVFYKNKPVEIPYTLEPETSTKYQGRSFHHGKFVSKLREAARQTKGVTLLEATVDKLLVCPDTDQIMGISCTTKDKTNSKQYHFGKITVVADGCFSKFRKSFTTSTPETMSHFVGFLLEDCPLPFPNHGHVVLAKQGPVLLYQIGTRDTRVLIDVPGKLPSVSDGSLKKYLLEEVAEYLPEQLQACFINAIENQKPRVMPNSMLSPSPIVGSGILVAGDAFNMRHPLTGGGMTVALSDVVRLRQLLSPLSSQELCNQDILSAKVQEFHYLRSSSSTVINILACALYRLFQSENDPSLLQLQEGCFEYFKLGGICIDGPVGFLSGIDGNLFRLIYHFFRVCLYAQFLQIQAAPLLLKPWALLSSMLLILKGAQIILPLVYAEFYFLRPNFQIFSTSRPHVYFLIPLLISLFLIYIVN
ncbi:Squalene epoxidase [Entomophthora muscae]|uniref:Squalene epoxidase n=1 Tax=Entomophthora muscae TaxID=34485 RepID=A0ACC2TJ93_9FUNG|nr:Squalene epoxidase [Entomophthora muscae]